MLRQIFTLSSYTFHWAALWPMITSAVMLGLGVYAYSKNTRSVVNRSFLLFTTIVGLWPGTYAWVYCCKDEYLALYLFKHVTAFFVSYIGTGVYFFTVTFLNLWDDKQRSIVRTNALLALLFYFLQIRGDDFVLYAHKYFWGWYIIYGPLSYPFLIFFFSQMIAAFAQFAKAYFREQSPIQKTRIKYVSIAFLIAYFGSVDFLPAYKIGVYPFGYVTLLIFASVIAYSIIRYKLLVVTAALIADNVVSTMAEALIVFGLEEKTVLLVNSAACKLLGYTKEELMGKPIEKLIAGFSTDGKGFMKTLLLKGQVLNYEMSYLTKNGRVIPVNFSGSVLKEGRGKATSIVGVARDIREEKKFIQELEKANDGLQEANLNLKKAQAQLVQSEKMASLGRLVAGVAHEINNPVGYVWNNLSVLQKYITDLMELERLRPQGSNALVAEKIKTLEDKRLPLIMDDLPKLIGETREGVQRIAQIVQDLRTFSHVDKQGDRNYSDINECIESTLRIVYNEPEYRITLVKEFGNIPLVWCNSQQLNQVFMNLIVNAIDAIEERGTITIRTQRDGLNHVIIHIIDTGCGITEENIHHIFEPFFTTKQVGKGTGLGLSIVYSIVQSHGGMVSVSSEPGKGSTFAIRLPIQPGPRDALPL